MTTTDALSPYSLLALAGPGAVVDFAKIDIEGAEIELLRHNAGWAHRVRTMAVEVHAPYTVDECRDDLARAGLRDPGRPASLGVRDRIPRSVTTAAQLCANSSLKMHPAVHALRPRG